MRRTIIALLAITLLSMFWIAPTSAQEQGGSWSEPIRLSSDAGQASEGYLAADQYGYVHCFWVESLHNSQRRVIKYARFDGEAWTNPNDIYFTNADITNISPVVDQQGTLHLAWTEGFFGEAFYTSAPVAGALSAQNWAQPIEIDINAKTLYLQVDSRNVFHILYNNQDIAPGIYYVRSEDRGSTWSEPVWLDPDILPNHIPDGLNFETDETDGLHAVWFYGGDGRTAQPDWIRYAHSMDGGETWSAPINLDQAVPESDHNLTSPGPKMIVSGQTVHVIWAAGSLPYRNHRYSTDAGQTWSAPEQIFGELHGQAGDGLAIDGTGRVHFTGQIRYPLAIYHAYWDNAQWTSPSFVYFIAEEGSEEAIGDRVHAHSINLAVRASNQLVLTFADGPADPNRRLFVVHRTLNDIPPLEPMQLPVLGATPLPTSGSSLQLQADPAPTMTPMVTQSSSPGPASGQPSGQIPRPDNAIVFALLPTLLLLGGFAFTRMFLKRGK